jgi:hypothetical protein
MSAVIRLIQLANGQKGDLKRRVINGYIDINQEVLWETVENFSKDADPLISLA